MTEPDTYEPLFLQRELHDKVTTIVDEWCERYMRGVVITAEQWMLDSLEMKILIAPILAFQGE